LIKRPLGEKIDPAAERMILGRERNGRERSGIGEEGERRKSPAIGSEQNASVGALFVVTRDETTSGRGQIRERRQLPIEQMGIKAGRPTHRLASVVDDEIEPRQVPIEETSESFDRRRQAEIETIDLELVAPNLIICLAGITERGVVRETCRDDDASAGAEQKNAGLIADFHASAGHEGDPTFEVRRLSSFRIIQLGARRAELIVEEMDLAKLSFADVTLARVFQLGGFVCCGRYYWRELGRIRRAKRGRHEDGRSSAHANAGRVEHRLFFAALGQSILAAEGLGEAPLLGSIGSRDAARGFEQASAGVAIDVCETSPVLDDGLEHGERDLDGAFLERSCGVGLTCVVLAFVVQVFVVALGFVHQ